MNVKNGEISCLDKLKALLKELGSDVNNFQEFANDIIDDNLYETKDFVKDLKFFNKKSKKWERTEAARGATIYNPGAGMEITMNKGVMNPVATLIHEMIHASGKHSTFSHQQITAAIHKLENTDAMGIDNFIGKYCSNPEEVKK